MIGPTVDYYSELAPDFRNDLQKKDYETDEGNEPNIELKEGKVYSKTLEDAGDDPSTHNQSSVIVKFVPDDENVFLFMGDAGRKAFDNMSEENIGSIKNSYWLKVPHHGSKYNLDNDMINHINPDVAYISTEKYGHYLSKAVVNALKKLVQMSMRRTQIRVCVIIVTPSPMLVILRHHHYRFRHNDEKSENRFSSIWRWLSSCSIPHWYDEGFT